MQAEGDIVPVPAQVVAGKAHGLEWRVGASYASCLLPLNGRNCGRNEPSEDETVPG